MRSSGSLRDMFTELFRVHVVVRLPYVPRGGCWNGRGDLILLEGGGWGAGGGRVGGGWGAGGGGGSGCRVVEHVFLVSTL